MRAARRLAAAAGVAVAGVVLGSCTSVRSDLGTGSSGCYVAIPAAAGAVHHRGTLRGALLESAARLRARTPPLAAVADTHGQRNVCLVAFTGHYTASSVADPAGAAAGNLAVVEVGYPDHRVLATFLAARQPLPFGHSHILSP
ncbi:MAG: hypothetical protein ACRDYZ_14670 [Acidimicrobiales bacterium]